ncbi:MAG TPA: hypothetical protein VF054_06450 [Micromonosporaceae bacterium]
MTWATEESTAAGIYGVIVGAAVMAASHAESALALIVSVLVTLVVYWAAERYARVIAERIHRGERPTWRRLVRQLTTGWEIVTASALPLVVLAVLDLLGVGVRVAALSALACSTLLLCLAGWAIGRDGRLSTRERVVSSVVAGLFGVLMVLLKAVLH